MYDIKRSSKFKTDYKSVKHNEKIRKELNFVVTELSLWHTLPENYHNHPLHGEYKWAKECHISPDVLLIYKIVEDQLILLLLRIGSHSELFE